MCELVLFGAGIIIMALLLWVVILDGIIQDHKAGVRKIADRISEDKK